MPNKLCKTIQNPKSQYQRLFLDKKAMSFAEVPIENALAGGYIAVSYDGNKLAVSHYSEETDADFIVIYDVPEGNLLTPVRHAECRYDNVSVDGVCFVSESNNVLSIGCCTLDNTSLLLEFTVDGKHVRSMPAYCHGNGIAYSSNVIYVSSNISLGRFSKVIMYDYASGAPLQMIGSYGSGPGQLRMVRGLAVTDDGHVFVCDAENDRVSKFKTDTGESCAHSFPVDYPVAVALQENNTVLVLCHSDARRLDHILYKVEWNCDSNPIILQKYDLSALTRTSGDPLGIAYCSQKSTMLVSVWAFRRTWPASDVTMWVLKDSAAVETGVAE